MPLCRVAMPARPQGQPGGMGCWRGAPCRHRDAVGSRWDVPCMVPTPGELDWGGMRLHAIPAAQMWHLGHPPASMACFGISDVPPPSALGLPAPPACPEAPQIPPSCTTKCTKAFQEQGRSPAVQRLVLPSHRPPRPGRSPACRSHHLQLVLKPPSPRKGGTRSVEDSGDRDSCPTAPQSSSPCQEPSLAKVAAWPRDGQRCTRRWGKLTSPPWPTHMAAGIRRPARPCKATAPYLPLLHPKPPSPRREGCGISICRGRRGSRGTGRYGEAGEIPRWGRR